MQPEVLKQNRTELKEIENTSLVYIHLYISSKQKLYLKYFLLSTESLYKVYVL